MVCKTLNISSKALRIYEAWEIVVPKRDENSYRNYSSHDLLKLRQIVLLKELGFSLKEIKKLITKTDLGDNELIRSLYLQSKAVENKIIELRNIKLTLNQNINEALLKVQELDYNVYLNKINNSLHENKENRDRWIDRWGFDSWAKKYDDFLRENIEDELSLFEKYDVVLEKVRDKIMKEGTAKVLDMGCGTGNLCGKLSSCIEVVGVDQSMEMLLEAKRKYPKMKLRLGSFMDEPFAYNEFDLVVSTYAFHHLKTIEKEIAIKLMLQYLKDNGKVVIADLMFFNQTERGECKKNLIKKGRLDLWELIEDEYYTDIESLKKYVEFLDCNITYEHIANFTWMLKIEKNK